MMRTFLTPEEQQLLDQVAFRLEGELLFVMFPSGSEECWTKAPPDYPTDGSVEVMRVFDAYYIAPPRAGGQS